MKWRRQLRRRQIFTPISSLFELHFITISQIGEKCLVFCFFFLFLFLSSGCNVLWLIERLNYSWIVFLLGKINFFEISQCEGNPRSKKVSWTFFSIVECERFSSTSDTYTGCPIWRRILSPSLYIYML